VAADDQFAVRRFESRSGALSPVVGDLGLRTVAGEQRLLLDASFVVRFFAVAKSALSACEDAIGSNGSRAALGQKETVSFSPLSLFYFDR
jgi:hypothetical protein